MKKKFGKLFIILGVIICIISLVGCDLFANDSETDSTASAETSEILSEREETYGKEEIGSDESDVTRESVEETSLNKENTDTKPSLSGDLIETLIKFLWDLNVDHDMPEATLAIKIDEIKNGDQPLIVELDPKDYYFVCGYFSDEHRSESSSYCCREEYTWALFEKENDIQEYYNGEKCIVAFQINVAKSVENMLLSNNPVPVVEHFQLYEPDFSAGFNIGEPIDFEKSFVLLNTSDKGKIYHSLYAYNSILNTLSCVYLDELYYITIDLYLEFPNGGTSVIDLDKKLRTEFGDYYEHLTRVMLTGKYSFVNENGAKEHFGLIQVKDFIHIIE